MFSLKKFFQVVFTLIIVLILGIVLKPRLNFIKSSDMLVSPWDGNGILAVNDWFPKVSASVNPSGVPDISAQAAYFVDIDSGQVLYQKNPHQRLHIASLTKIMTVILTLENKKWTDVITISPEAAAMEPDHMELLAGEKLSVEELLDGVFLISANDAAEALAENALPGGRQVFIDQMNQKAQLLGMNDSHFINPTGLEEDGKEQYSSAYDVTLLARYAIKHFPHTVDISSTPHILIPQTANHQDYDLYSGINLLTTYPGVLGYKTGYTPEAGLTLVTFAKKNNHEVLGVILNSDDRRGEARELLDYCFSKLSANS